MTEADSSVSGRWGPLASRSGCPVCRQPGTPVLSLPYDGEPIASYLIQFYDGAIDPADLAGQRYELVQCASCGLVYQVGVPNEELLDHLYGVAALHDVEATQAARGLAVRRSYANDVEQCIKYFDAAPASIEVLDFGSGAGLWLDMAAAFGCRTSGAELAETALGRLRAAGHDAFILEELPSERFHFVNTEQVVEHLVEPCEVLQQLVDALRPGGLLRISVPNGAGIVDRLEHADWRAPKGSPASLNAVAPLEHLNCFDHGSLRQLGQSVGLEPFHYPLRQYLEPMERMRFAVSALVHRVRRPEGTLQLFRKPLR